MDASDGHMEEIVRNLDDLQLWEDEIINELAAINAEHAVIICEQRAIGKLTVTKNHTGMNQKGIARM